MRRMVPLFGSMAHFLLPMDKVGISALFPALIHKEISIHVNVPQRGPILHLFNIINDHCI